MWGQVHRGEEWGGSRFAWRVENPRGTIQSWN